jgi:hypothetical protein
MTSYGTREYGGTMWHGLAVKECGRCGGVARPLPELIHTPPAHQPSQAYIRPSHIAMSRFSER